ncbi:MAG: hypothetical protein GXW85_03735 [Clostridia bacterium]|nr:hypothetical protein [Clostridia bacterium]
MSFWKDLFGSTQTALLRADGISVEPKIPELGEEVQISYNGPLAQNGAGQIYLHFGYGSDWHNSEDIPMQMTPNGWTCKIVPEDRELNFCFRDEANNWDNNDGSNWTVTIN